MRCTGTQWPNVTCAAAETAESAIPSPPFRGAFRRQDELRREMRSIAGDLAGAVAEFNSLCILAI